ncbi:MAG: DUF1801 domain-containing protein [Actinomycetota bacterium]
MANNDISVDEFVETRVLPELQPVVGMLRELMRECAPNARELISYGIPTYRGHRGLAVISPTKKDITFAFSRGAEFEDKYGLLTGVGKVSKNVKIKDLGTVNKEALRYYIKQALELDEK